jgi:hypothetical protein
VNWNRNFGHFSMDTGQIHKNIPNVTASGTISRRQSYPATSVTYKLLFEQTFEMTELMVLDKPSC